MSLKIWLPLNGNIENQGTLNTKSRLPSGYTEVEYLESSGTQWINTNDKLTSDFKMVYSINVQNGGSSSAMPWASYATGNRYNCQFPEHTAIWFQRAGGTLYRGNLDGTILNKDLYIEESLNSVSINGKVYGTGSFTFTQNNVNVGLFNSPGSSYQSANKCRTFKWFAGNTLKHCFVPCYRNSDNKPGMYDTVTGTFYTNAGSGEFSVGPAVTCTITNNGATVDNNGKIGKCYSLAGGTITATAPKVTNKITIAAWIKAPDNNSVWRRVCGMQSTSTSWKSASALLLLKGTNLYFSISNGSTCTQGNCAFNIGDSSNWFHACGTYDGTTARLYVNGVLKKEVAITTTIENTPIWLGGTSAGERFTGKLNDFRLYDECLSADQIKEISRGMVLHYKMCQPERSENLLANGAATEITCRSQNQDYPLKAIRTTLENNTQYTLSFDAKSDNGLGTFYCSLANGGSSQIYFATKIKPTTKYKHFVYTATRGTQTTNNILFAAYYGWSENANVTDTIHIKNVKLEKGSNPNATFSPPPTETLNWGTIEYDGSGFKNHGTVSGNVTLSADSPRYTGSYNLSDGNYITAPGFTYINSGSISFWAKINTLASNGWLPFTGPTTGYYIMATTGGTGSFYHNAVGNGTKTIYEDGKVIIAPSSIGVWHHYVITNVDLTTWTKFMINNYDYNWNANMQMSDIRVYSTILDATDVAELYKLGR